MPNFSQSIFVSNLAFKSANFSSKSLKSTSDGRVTLSPVALSIYFNSEYDKHDLA